MGAYSNKSCLIYDHGLFVELALTLKKDFGRVYYYAPYENGYPKSNALLIGEGLPGVTRVESIWPLIDEVDLFVFPDIYEGPLQMHLASLGKRVFGGRMGEELELDRVASKKHLKSVGIDVGPFQIVKGLDALRDYLKEHENVYVKISRTRGDMETFHSRDYRLIEPRLDDLEHSLGAKKRIMEFLVEEAIEPAVEVGYDGFTVDGQFPKGAMVGIEIKDKGLVMRTRRYDDLPQEVRGVNDKLAGTFKNYNYRGFWSSEIRITKDRTPYVIDPCARAGSPPSELYQILVDNWADIMWHGAEGVLVEPHFTGTWGAELLLLSSWADKNWQCVDVPKEIRENVKLRNLTIIENRMYVAPQWTGMPEIGAVVAVADSQKAACEECLRLAEKVEGYFIEIPAGALDTANDEIKKLADFGIEF